jgi:preprotein translocase subunit SecF
MFRLFTDSAYDILSYRRIAYTVAAVFIIPGLIFLAIGGLNFSIEFTGGTLIVIEAHDPAIVAASMRPALQAGGIADPEIQVFGTENEFAIRARLDPEATDENTQQTAEAVAEILTDTFGAGSYTVILTEAVGPKVGGELRQKAVLALVLGFGAIFFYLWMRYEWRFGTAAVLAAMHDIMATFAFLAYLRIEMSLFVVASLLLIVGYSLNDTIVTFDRVRENLRKYRRDKFYGVLNRSINETLPRTVLTSGTTLAASLSLVILGGEVLSGPLMVVTFGIITGTFSSIFIASPILMAIEQRWPGEDVRGAKDIGSAPGTTIVTPKA